LSVTAPGSARCDVGPSPAGSRVKGRVLQGGAPVKIGGATLVRADGGASLLALIEDEGRFTFEGVAPGRYTIKAGAALAGSPREVAIVDEDGDACAGAHAVLAPADEPPVLAAGLLSEATAVDAGIVELASVPGGRWDVWAFADGRAVGVARGVELAEAHG